MVSGRSGMARSYRLRSPLAPRFIGSGRYEGRQLKAKEFIYLLGLKPKPETFGFVIEAHDLPREGRIEVARWLHPGAYRVAPLQLQAAVDQLRRFLRAGDVAIDIGAHTGDTTIPIALAIGATGLVLGLEPNPYVFPVLERNASLNPAKTTILPLNFAAMRTDGFYEFQYGEEGYCNGGFHEGMSKWVHGSAFKVRVEGRNVQAFLTGQHPDLIPRLRFIKIDAEGFDLPILEALGTSSAASDPFSRWRCSVSGSPRPPIGSGCTISSFVMATRCIGWRATPTTSATASRRRT